MKIDFKKPEDWLELNLPFNIASGRSFIPDSKGRSGIQLAFYERRSDRALVGKVLFDELVEGPPKHVHGGVSSYILDEAMGSAAWLRKIPVLAKTPEISLLKMTPIDQMLDVEAQVVEARGADLVIEAKVFASSSGIVYSKSRGQFAIIEKQKFMNFVNELNLNIDPSKYKFSVDSHEY